MLRAATIKLRSFATVSSHEGEEEEGEKYSVFRPLSRGL